MRTDDSQALDRTFEDARANLKSALSEACRADIEHANTGELIRVEEVLAIANEAAKEAISVRRRIATERRPTQALPAEGPSASREVKDEYGVRWSAFEVHPTTSADRPSVRERFRDGWLSFDSGAETRRVAPIPAGWQELIDEQLLELLKHAEPAMRRARTSPVVPITPTTPTTRTTR
ncbi:MAG TPA: hypothetical protein VN706_18345 [Gemmatimonadaceae bacterium]|nr:hypothetical protein [Gemmatimonadaceae bacterium]